MDTTSITTATNVSYSGAIVIHNGITEDQLTIIKVLSIVIAILGTCGNSIVIIAICRGRLYKQPIFVKILNLTVCNWIHSAIFLPLMALQAFTGIWTHKTNICNAVSFGLYSNLGTELWGYVFITLNRYFCVLHHDQYVQFYKNNAVHVAQFIFSWSVYPILLTLPLFGLWSHYEYAPKKLICHPFIGESCNSYCYFIFLLSFLITVPVITYCYGQILLAYIKVQKDLNRASSDDLGNSHQARLRDEVKLAFTILLVILMFGTFHIPFLTLYMYDPAMIRVDPLVHTLLIYIGANSNWINPIIYAFSNKSIRHAIKETLRQ